MYPLKFRQGNLLIYLKITSVGFAVFQKMSQRMLWPFSGESKTLTFHRLALLAQNLSCISPKTWTWSGKCQGMPKIWLILGLGKEELLSATIVCGVSPSAAFGTEFILKSFIYKTTDLGKRPTIKYSLLLILSPRWDFKNVVWNSAPYNWEECISYFWRLYCSIRVQYI